MKKMLSDRGSRDNISKEKQKYQILMQDYLELQKELMSKKKKLEAANMKRESRAAEVRFLRRRYQYLLNLQSAEVEAEARHRQDTNADPCDKPDSNERKNYNSDFAKAHGDALGLRWEAIRRNKKPKNCLINGKEMGKRKISWQDPVALGV